MNVIVHAFFVLAIRSGFQIGQILR